MLLSGHHVSVLLFESFGLISLNTLRNGDRDMALYLLYTIEFTVCSHFSKSVL
jgi:hypothetical protein